MGWLVAIARNIAFDHHRRQRRELASLGDPIEELPDPRSDRGTALDRRALIDRLDRLEPEPRRCALLAYQGGYSYDELSTMLGRPSGTIKSWVHRSLQRLRACRRPVMAEDDLPEVLAGEYVLGVLNADERAAFELQTVREPALAHSVEEWQARLLPLDEGLAPMTPSPEV